MGSKASAGVVPLLPKPVEREKSWCALEDHAFRRRHAKSINEMTDIVKAMAIL
jgi:hypothetical protein